MEFIPIDLDTDSGAKKPNPRRALVRAVVALMISIGLAGIGIWRFSQRAPKRAFFRTSCQSIVVPTGLLLTPSNRGVFVHTRGFTGSMDRVEALEIQKHKSIGMGTVSFAQVQDPRVSSLPTLTVELTAPLGPITLNTTGRSRISASDDSKQDTRLEIAALDSNTDVLDMQASILHIKEVRLRNPEIHDLQDAEITATNKRVMLHLSLTSLPVLGTDMPMLEIHYQPGEAVFQLLPGNDTPGMKGAIELDRCVDSDIDVFGGDEIQRPQTSAFGIRAQDVTIQELKLGRITSGNEKRPVIGITMIGTVFSVMQNDRQLLPTELSDLLKRPAYEVGLWGALVLFVLSSGGVLIKRSLDIIAAALIPDGKG